MKKILLSILLIGICMFLVGCEGNKAKNWELDLDSNNAYIEEDALDVFQKAVEDKYEIVALLGKQLVAGTNYMFLCRDDSYKIVVINNDLENKATILSEKEFDVTKYIKEKKEPEYVGVVGGWKVTIPQRKTILEEEVRESFDHASEKQEGIRYFPAAQLAHQSKSGNYLFLAYGETEDQYKTTGVYVLTLHKEEFVGYAYIDLTEFAE